MESFKASFEVVTPRADSLMESLRATGYSLPDAVSDLIDNSITAGARNVWLDFRWSGRNSRFSILDDGSGMSEPELVDAMRIGSRSPSEIRDPTDLGRYGLGLKTASISQARSLTVASRTKNGGGIGIRRWDLDHLISTGDWQLLTSAAEGASEDLQRLSRLKHGTLVVWTKMDKLVGDFGADDADARRQFQSALRGVEDQLAMVFHRFMIQANNLSIFLNGESIKPWDPFLADEPATQRLQTETHGSPAAGMVVTPYVLPHHSHLNPVTHRAAAGPKGWNAQQGFYIYRNRRLLLSGDWLGLGFTKEEHYKLARIQVDLPNSADHEWQVDVRKSTARPPLRQREHLRRIAEVTRRRAVDVYRRRGKTIARGVRKSPVFVWQKRVKGKKFSYAVNREHPLVRDALALSSLESSKLRQILRLVEEYVPVQQIWVDMAEGDESLGQPFESAADLEIMELVRALYAALIKTGLTHDQAVARLGTTEAIGDRFELVEPSLVRLSEERTIE